MSIDRTGCTRIVILTRRYAIKIPNFRDDWPRLFCKGICANIQEASFATTGWPELCPVLFSLPWGLLLAMPRLRLLTDEEFAEHISEGWKDRGDYVIPVEMKSNSFGWLNSHPVAIDYGSWQNSVGMTPDHDIRANEYAILADRQREPMRAVAENYDCELWARCHLLDAHLAHPDAYDSSVAPIVTATISEQAELTITLLWNHAADEARRQTVWNQTTSWQRDEAEIDTESAR